MLNIVLIFSKVPVPGLVKTRLAQNTVLSEKDTALIAEAMLKDTISLSAESKADQIYLGYFPQTQKPNLEKIVKTLQNEKNLDKSVEYILQKGSNFDERFGSAVNSAFLKGATNIIVLGADLPYMDPLILNKAFEYLSSGDNKRKVVIGPANGGGIYLVGINEEFNHKWFTDYHLFRGGVELSQFSLLCKNKNLDLILLPAFGDVDLEEDLVSLMAYIEALLVSKTYEGFYFPSYSAKIIDKLGLYIHEIENDTRNRRIRKK
ncbi:MAG: DUF2064 domain-containing protein [Promethearchaeota archaeon]|nr:MAG: DUF2064 domain-containing protein [Candidatus Lokiarchaeota archaeon]